MAKDIIISINAGNGFVYKSAETLGINGENIDGQIIVEFFNGDFVDGVASIEIERGSDKGIIAMTKNADTKTYRLPIKSSLLSTIGEIKAQVTITQTKKGTEIPVFKSKIFTLTVGEAINATATIPDEYPTWLETANAKIAEMDALMDDMEQKEGVYKHITFGTVNSITTYQFITYSTKRDSYTKDEIKQIINEIGQPCYFNTANNGKGIGCIMYIEGSGIIFDGVLKKNNTATFLSENHELDTLPVHDITFEV